MNKNMNVYETNEKFVPKSQKLVLLFMWLPRLSI